MVDEGISEDEAWRLFLQFVDALSHMSTHAILHRDIKLTNIFIGIIIPFPRKHMYFYWSSVQLDAQGDCKVCRKDFNIRAWVSFFII